MLRSIICISGLLALSVAACTTDVPSTSESYDVTASSGLSAPANDFSISVSPTSQDVFTNTNVSYTVSTAVTAGSAQTIDLSVSGLPCGVTGSFNPSSVAAGGSSTLTLSLASNAACTSATFAVTGTGTDATHMASASFTVIGCVLFNINVSPTSQTIDAGSSKIYTILTTQNSCLASLINLSVIHLPLGIIGSFNPTSVTTGGSSTLTLTAAAPASLGATNFTITGTSTSSIQSTDASITVASGTFTPTDVPKAIPDNNATGVTSNLPVTGNCTVASLALSLNITHTFRGDLVVTLIGPDGTQFVVANRAGGSADNIVINSQAITTFNGRTAAGTWRLRVQDLAAPDVGTLNSWSLRINSSNCGPQPVPWSVSATPNLPTIDNGMACTNLTVPSAPGSDSSLAKLDIVGRHDFCSVLSGTLSHNGTTVTTFPTGTFPASACNFSFTNRAVAGLSGDASGTWTFCITDNDVFGDIGALNSWSVHN
jgi:subtilisin-like proprotein convertase family protein